MLITIKTLLNKVSLGCILLLFAQYQEKYQSEFIAFPMFSEEMETFPWLVAAHPATNQQPVKASKGVSCSVFVDLKAAFRRKKKLEVLHRFPHIPFLHSTGVNTVSLVFQHMFTVGLGRDL